MFTGIIEQTGKVLSQQEHAGLMRLVLAPAHPADFSVAIGDSVAINGVCLTVVAATAASLSFELSRETLAQTSLGRLQVGSLVNLERALRAADRLGGHLVSGHVDGQAKVVLWDKRADGWHLGLVVPPSMRQYMVAKGSITVEGVSLTINAVQDEPRGTIVSLMLIPLTIARTTLGDLQLGAAVNIESDMVARYLERLLVARNPLLN